MARHMGMVMSARWGDARSPGRIIASAVGTAIILTGVVAVAAGSIGRLVAERDRTVAAAAAEESLAVTAGAAIASATSSEKNAMLATDKAHLDDFASAWVTAIDHFKATLEELKQHAATPQAADAIVRIEDALAVYVARGGDMYQLKLSHETDEAIAISSGPAQAARAHVVALVEQQIESRRAAREAFDNHFLGLIALATIRLALTIALAAWLASRLVLRPIRAILPGIG